VDERLCLHQLTHGLASEELVVTREALIGKLTDRLTAERARLVNVDSNPIGEINSLLGFFARCTLCADCLDACPIYSGEFTGMLGVGEAIQSGNPLLAELVAVSRWLASCSGCGMCQEACENGAALGQIITAVSHRIRTDLHYMAGDPRQRLPWGINPQNQPSGV
jgi:L-lactate utilization protein LutB